MKPTGKNDRYVQPSKAGAGWDVVKSGHKHATWRADTKSEAIARAKKAVRSEGGGEIRIMNRSGKMVDSNTVRSRPFSRRGK